MRPASRPAPALLPRGSGARASAPTPTRSPQEAGTPPEDGFGRVGRVEGEGEGEASARVARSTRAWKRESVGLLFVGRCERETSFLHLGLESASDGVDGPPPEPRGREPPQKGDPSPSPPPEPPEDSRPLGEGGRRSWEGVASLLPVSPPPESLTGEG